MKLNNEFVERIKTLHQASQKEILARLEEFKSVKEDKIFYELCFCLCTPQSKAENAFKVQKILESKNYFENDLDIAEILFDKNHYIRFHNQKAKWIDFAKVNYAQIKNLLDSNLSPEIKRIELKNAVLGFGMKESAHFMRNIGYRGLGILDRHILNCMIQAGALKIAPKLDSEKKYLEIEKKFQIFAKKINIDLDELDLTLWSLKAGKILK